MLKDRNLLIVNALGLVKGCPAGKPLGSCIFQKMSDRFSLRQSYNYLGLLDESEISKMLRAHFTCFSARMEQSCKCKMTANNGVTD